MRWPSRTLLAAVLTCLIAALLPGTATAAHCANVSTSHIKAKNVRTFEGLRCSLARKTLKRYFRKVVGSAQTQGGCAQKRFTTGCRARSFRCYSSYGGGRITGECTGPNGTVRFREFDFGPG
jgi:hypothetical protein